ncbi:MAG: undecaprenyl/decaprenyl-phosphate alpha-N-acetylglucosaminyl 1-phosphate transferase [Bacteroidetes bacterium]|nr:MAG: undecaprenyl/decaprenyl-phosphate alpha-N-acetylglucosaminyl 1-phosphate transferase [Bacteroidota bacterium]
MIPPHLLEIAPLVLALLCSFGITFFAIPSVIEVAHKKRLFDLPDERKQHAQAIPRLGGVGMYVGMMVSLCFFVSREGFGSVSYLLAAYMILFFVALKDDLITVSTPVKLLFQILVAGILIFNGLRITSLHYLLGIGELSMPVSVLLTLVLIVGIVNAFNLIDGVDGLAGGLGGINSLTLGALLFVYGDRDFAIVAFILGGCLLAFLRYNFAQYPNKIFMGDSGSLLVGLTLAILAVRFIETPPPPSIHVAFASPVLVVLGIMIIPIFDVLRVMLIRISQRRSPFSPDRNHIHHALLRSGFSHRGTSLLLYAVNLLFVCMVVVFRDTHYLGLSMGLLAVAAFSTQAVVLFRYFRQEKQISQLEIQLGSLQKENRFLI